MVFRLNSYLHPLNAFPSCLQEKLWFERTEKFAHCKRKIELYRAQKLNYFFVSFLFDSSVFDRPHCELLYL